MYGRKGKKMIETFVKQQGIFYVMLGLCVIGAIGRLFESRIYARLIKAMENPERLEHPFLKQLKLKYKSYCRLERKVHNVDAFVETNLFRYKHRQIWFGGLHNISNQMMLLCIMASCAGIGSCIYYEMDKWQMMYYILAGALAVAVLELLDMQFGNESKKRYLFVSIKDYLENVLANQMDGTVRTTDGAAKELKEKASGVKTPESHEQKAEKQIAAAKAEKPSAAKGERKNAATKAEKQVAAAKAAETDVNNKAADEELEKKKIAQEKVIAEVIKEFFP